MSMLGHLKPHMCSLYQEAKEDYYQLYCGTCAAIRQHHAFPYVLLVNHEITLVLLAFRIHYEKESKALRTPCPASVFTKRQSAYQHPAIDLAGRLSLLLGSIKVMDWAVDTPKFYKRWPEKWMSKKVKNILPELSMPAREIIREYIHLTRNNSTNFEKVKKYSGLLSQIIAQEIGKKTKATHEVLAELGELFRLCGELISVADHLIDLEQDMLKKHYNPIVDLAEKRQVSLNETYVFFMEMYTDLRKKIQQQLQKTEDALFLPLLSQMHYARH